VATSGDQFGSREQVMERRIGVNRASPAYH